MPGYPPLRHNFFHRCSSTLKTFSRYRLCACTPRIQKVSSTDLTDSQDGRHQKISRSAGCRWGGQRADFLGYQCLLPRCRSGPNTRRVARCIGMLFIGPNMHMRRKLTAGYRIQVRRQSLLAVQRPTILPTVVLARPRLPSLSAHQRSKPPKPSTRLPFHWTAL